MFAIVEIAGQQFKVAKDQKVFVHRLDAKTGDKVSFDQVYMLADGDKVTVGAPAVANASVEAKVVRHLKDDKVIVFKKKRRKGYRVKNGHRQSLTEIVIESLGAGAAKKAPAKKAAAKKESAPKKKAPKATDFSSKTVAELKELAKAAGIEGISSMKKADLVAALEAKK
jgi:large subunit ribosomal protein L21